MRRYRYTQKHESIIFTKPPFKFTEFEIDHLLLPLLLVDDNLEEDWLDKELESFQSDGRIDQKWKELDEILGFAPGK